MTGFSAANRSSLVTDALHRLLALRGFRIKIPHFATKAIFEMGSNVCVLVPAFSLAFV